MASQLSAALVWEQFAAYHVDRCEAVAARLAGRCDVLALEVATSSETYAWEPSGAVARARKVTLFPGQVVERIGALKRFVRLLLALWRCDIVFMGIPYSAPDVIVLSWLLPVLGVRVVMMTDSKFDDFPRSAGFEFFKSLVLRPYWAMLASGPRTKDYLRFLGFRNRPVELGYDTVSVDRMRRAAGHDHDRVPFSKRPFVFVGRFVEKKNLLTLVEAYARYVERARDAPHRLVLSGDGPLAPEIRQMVTRLGLDHLVDFPGFLPSSAVSRQLDSALALILISRNEQWGLVINEAVALGVPVICSYSPGARDLLVSNLVNGIVVEGSDPHAVAMAMAAVASDEARWHAMSANSLAKAGLADTERFADACEQLFTRASAKS